MNAVADGRLAFLSFQNGTVLPTKFNQTDATVMAKPKSRERPEPKDNGRVTCLSGNC